MKITKLIYLTVKVSLMITLMMPTIKVETVAFTGYDHNLRKINKKLEEIEQDFKSGNYIKACKNSSEVSILIKENLNQLNKSEPYYNWEKIDQLLMDIPNAYCK